MTPSDLILLVKKILIGIIVTLIPFLILFCGLWFTQKFLNDGIKDSDTTLEVSNKDKQH